MRRKYPHSEFLFEEAASDDWAKDLEVAEIPLGDRSFFYLGVGILSIGLVVLLRILWLGVAEGSWYSARAASNMKQVREFTAPRGLIEDRNGKILADNKAVFFAALDTKAFIQNPNTQSTTLQEVQNILGLSPEEVSGMIQAGGKERVGEPIILNTNLSQSQVIQISRLNASALSVLHGFERTYNSGPIFSGILGYTGFPSEALLTLHPELDANDEVGKAGIEYVYDEVLRGKPGQVVTVHDSHGNILNEEEKSAAEIGDTLRLTIDAELQKYFYQKLADGLHALGRDTGTGLVMNPKTGEVLALITIPSFDNNLFTSPGHSTEKQALLTSPLKPLLNRAIGGAYNPGSTIKPLVAVAALKEGVVDPSRKVFSPGYLLVPNQYHPDQPTKYADWKYQGWIDLYSAIAQSSNVYFYLLGGGSPAQYPGNSDLDGQAGIKGLGITKLNAWWQKFRLGTETGIDLPGEVSGSLPSPEKKTKAGRGDWLLGDTYNVSIGQGDLLITPIQLLQYISTIANNGKMYAPYLAKDKKNPTLTADLSDVEPQIKEVQEGMYGVANSPLSSSYNLLHTLPMKVAGKTGTAQISLNTKTNAFFVGYAPYDDPQMAMLILVENSREGSLNTIPIARDVFNWYYENRIKNK